jgi:SET domain-containing protein
MKSDNVTIKKSKIHGKGVFATCNFKKGEIVLKWDISNNLNKSVVDKMNDKEKEYIAFIDNKYIIMQEPEKFVNHSCDANTIAGDFCDVAKRDIKAGEEITANYEEELPPNTTMECNCGSKKCKKIIGN